jgi:hypothetical protein
MLPATLSHVAYMTTQINTGLRPDPVHNTLQKGTATAMNRNPMTQVPIIPVYMISVPIQVVV